MEYEIDDDPQGLPDRPEGSRDGGLRDTLFSRKERKTQPVPRDEDTAFEQTGELA